jgi:hypothetical protein|tara:strand:+ start:38 stop:484 length:447 start_codon:yes stop_codon:yes gene_type:complete
MDFSTIINCNAVNFFKVLTDYEQLVKYLPRQLNDIKILSESENISTIEVSIIFKTLIKKEIKQKMQISKKFDNRIIVDVLDGHAKNTKVVIEIKSENSKTQINTDIDLKLSLKSKILLPVIKREYKVMLQGVFMKIGIDAEKMESEEK